MPDITLDQLTSGAAYPQWATEESLKKLLKQSEGMPLYHRFMTRFATKMATGGGDIADAMRYAAREMKAWSKEVKKSGRETASTASSMKGASDSTAKFDSSVRTASSRLGEFAKSALRTDSSMAGAYGQITDILKTAASLIGSLGKSATGILGMKGIGGGGFMSKIFKAAGDGMTAIVAAMAAALGTAMTIVDDFGSSLRKTGDLGISFGESFMDLRVQLGTAGLGLSNLEKQTALNSTAFALMGDTVQDGVKAWIDWRKRVIVDGDMEYFANLGFAIEELNDYFLKDTRNRILSGRSREQATEEVTESMRDLARNTKAVSELTGESRKKLMQAVIERESDAKWQAYLGTLPVDEQKEMESSLRNMITLYGLSEKQQKAVQDAIRMGGDVSLLAENIFGDAFADWKFMPKALNEMQDTIKRVASGEVIDDAQFRRMALTYHDAIMEFWKTPQGKLIARIGGSIIDVAAIFAARQQAMLYTQDREGFLAGGGPLLEGRDQAMIDKVDAENITLLGGAQLAAILQNIFAKEVTDRMRSVIEENIGGLFKARAAGDRSEEVKILNELESVFKGAGILTGAVTGMLADFAIDTAKIIIKGAVEFIDTSGNILNWLTRGSDTSESDSDNPPNPNNVSMNTSGIEGFVQLQQINHRQMAIAFESGVEDFVRQQQTNERQLALSRGLTPAGLPVQAEEQVLTKQASAAIAENLDKMIAASNEQLVVTKQDRMRADDIAAQTLATAKAQLVVSKQVKDAIDHNGMFT